MVALKSAVFSKNVRLSLVQVGLISNEDSFLQLGFEMCLGHTGFFACSRTPGKSFCNTGGRRRFVDN